MVATCDSDAYSIQDEKDSNRQRCSGMYSRKSWGGSVDPFILVDLEKQTPDGDADPIVSLVIFEWRDEGFVGRYPSPEAIEVWPTLLKLR